MPDSKIGPDQEPQASPTPEHTSLPKAVPPKVEVSERRSDVKRAARKGPLPILSVLADTPAIPDKVFARLPRPIRRALPAFTEQAERDVFTTASLGVLSGCLPNTSGRYDTGRFSPPLFCCITAPAASGKGTLSHARRLGDEVQGLFQEEYLEQKKDQEAKRKPIMDQAVFETETPGTSVSAPSKGEGKADGGEQPINFRLEGEDIEEFLRFDTPDAKPAPKKVANRKRGPDLSGEGEEPFLRRLILSGDISSSALIQMLEENGGFGIVFETEIDTVHKSQKQDWGGTSDTLRKAHAHETVSYIRVGGVTRIVDRPDLAVVLAGTPKQVIRFIPSPEDGLFSRFLFYGFLPDNPLSWKDVQPREDLPDLDKVLLEGAREVRQLWSTLEGRGKDNPLNVVLLPHHWVLLNAKMGAIKEYLFTHFDYAGSSTAHRTGLHVFRIAMILAVWRAFEEGRDLTLEKTVTVEDEEFEAALTLALTYAKHATALMRAYPREESAPAMSDDEARLYQALPKEFGRAEGVRIASGLGVTERTLDRRLNKWVRMGDIHRPRKGAYLKVDRQGSPEPS